jgi:ParB-like chromosome segregation protein Spo0J
VLDRVGWVSEVLVNRRTGHLRVELALSRGEPTVPVSYVDLDEDEEALVFVSLDPLSAMAATDDAKLAELLAEVAVDEADLAAALGLGAGEPASREYDETAADAVEFLECPSCGHRWPR